jgi:hypothetical protein
MPYSFGAGGVLTHRLSWTSNIGFGGTSRQYFICGWWKPLISLTASRRFWGSGTTSGAAIASTTTEIVTTLNATTPATWTTIGANLTLDQWIFIAWFFNISSNVANSFQAMGQIWVGTETTPPTLLSTTYVAPVTTITAFNTAMVICNGTGNIGSVGDASNFLLSGSSTGGIAGPYGVVVNVVPTADQLLNIENIWVKPMWLGNMPINILNRYPVGDLTYEFLSMDDNFRSFSRGTTMPDITTTITGATYSKGYSPRTVRGPNGREFYLPM